MNRITARMFRGAVDPGKPPGPRTRSHSWRLPTTVRLFQRGILPSQAPYRMSLHRAIGFGLEADVQLLLSNAGRGGYIDPYREGLGFRVP